MKTYYNILIEKDSVSDSYIENLVLKIDNSLEIEEVSAYIIKYLTNNGEIANEKELTNLFGRYSQNCSKACSPMCSTGEGADHVMYGPGCFFSYWGDCTTTCDGGGIVGGGNNNEGFEIGGGSTGGSGGGSATPQDTIASPNNDGAGSGNEVNELIVALVEDEEEENVQVNPCIKMIALLSDTGFKNSLQSLKTAANTNNYETVKVLSNNNSNTPTNNYNYVTTNGTAGNPSASYVFYTGVSKGILHNHYGGLLSIFTITDLEGIYKIVKDPNTVAQDLIFCVVTNAGTVYALTISNKDQFIKFGDKNLSTSYLKNYLNLQAIDNFDIKETNDINTNEEGFLSLMKDYKMGINLFKGDITNFNSWTRIEKIKRTFTKINCN